MTSLAQDVLKEGLNRSGQQDVGFSRVKVSHECSIIATIVINMKMMLYDSRTWDSDAHVVSTMGQPLQPTSLGKF